MGIGWNQVPNRPPCSETQKQFHCFTQIDRPEAGWRLDAVRHEYSDSCASSFAEALDEAIKSLERDSEQPAGEHQLHDDNEVGSENTGKVTTDTSCDMKNNSEERTESSGFANALDVALGILESEEFTYRIFEQGRRIDASQDSRTLAWVLDHSGQCGGTTSSEFSSGGDVDELENTSIDENSFVY